MADVSISSAPIDVRKLEAKVGATSNGAILTFVGRVRDNARGRATSHIEYNAYVSMAEKLIREIADTAEERWGCVIAVRHRIGRLELSEASVAIAVGSPHRGEAFEACRYVIDTLKEQVPIWKKEVGPDGSFWIEGDAAVPSETVG